MNKYVGRANGWDFCIVLSMIIALMKAGEYLISRKDEKKKK